MPIVDGKLKLVQNAAIFEGLFNAVSTHPDTGTKFFKDDMTWDTVPKQFQSVITVAKTGHGDFVCSDAAYTSDDQCIQAALDYISNIDGGVLYITSGRYACIAQLEYVGDNLVFFGDGDSTVLDFTEAGFSATAISVHGAVSATNSILAADAHILDNTITVTDGTKFSAGDWIRIRSDAVYGSHAPGYTYEYGEIQKIKSVSGNIITLSELVLMDYLISDAATVDIVTICENITFNDLKIVCSPAKENHGIICEYCYNVTIDNITCDDTVMRATALLNVVNGSVINCNISGATKTGLGYGINVCNASRNITGINNKFSRCRHGIACSGAYTYGVIFNQCYIGNTQSYDLYTIGMFGMHECYNGLTVMGNTTTGCTLGYFAKHNNTIVGNVVLFGPNDAHTGGQPGIFLFGCEGAIVEGNVVTASSNTAAIYAKNGNSILSNIIINSNTLDSRQYGIILANGFNNISISNNNIHTNLNSGIMVKSKYSPEETDAIAIGNLLSISNNTIGSDTGAGINVECTGVYNLENVNISNNNIHTASTVIGCIRVRRADSLAINKNVNIIGNMCNGGTTSVLCSSTDDILISGNKLCNATTGILLSNAYMNCHDYTVETNKFSGCTTAINNQSAAVDGIIRDNTGYNPVGNFTAPTLPASTVAYTNNYGYPCMVSISGGTVSAISIDGVTTGHTSDTVILSPGETIAITYSSAPTWKWWGL